MTSTDAALHRLTGERALAEEAAKGTALAFDELFRRYHEQAWDLAVAITGDPTRSADAVRDGFAATLTAVAAGRLPVQVDFRPALLGAVRNAAVDATHGTPAAPIDDSIVAGALADLPERWRSTLWLSMAAGLDIEEVSRIVNLDRADTASLLDRASEGLRQRILRDHLAANGEKNCARTVARLSAAASGTLTDDDMAKLERHLHLCDKCQERHDVVTALDVYIAGLALPVLATTKDRVLAAYVPPTAVAAGRTGMSENTEKVLAGVSAFAAAIGVLSAALFGLDNTLNRGDDLSAAPLAPLVTEIATPKPIDLTSAISMPSRAIASRQPGPGAGGVAAAAVNEAVTVTTAPPAGTHTVIAATNPTKTTTPSIPAGGDGPGDPESAAETDDGVVIGLAIGDVPIAVEIGPDPGLTVGPVSIGSEPQPSDERNVIDAAPAPVVEAIQTVTATPAPAAVAPVVAATPAPVAAVASEAGL